MTCARRTQRVVGFARAFGVRFCPSSRATWPRTAVPRNQHRSPPPKLRFRAGTWTARCDCLRLQSPGWGTARGPASTPSRGTSSIAPRLPGQGLGAALPDGGWAGKRSSLSDREQQPVALPPRRDVQAPGCPPSPQLPSCRRFEAPVLGMRRTCMDGALQKVTCPTAVNGKPEAVSGGAGLPVTRIREHQLRLPAHVSNS